MKLINIKVSDK